MNPPDQPSEPYTGPERRRYVRREEDCYQPPAKHGLFTTWQWAVICSYFVAIILSFIAGVAANRALDNTERIDKALCTQIAYLERQAKVAMTPAARDNLNAFAASLRPLVPSCPPPERLLKP